MCRTVSHCALPYSEGWWLKLNWILTIFYAVIEALTFGQYLLPQGLWFEHIRTYTSWVYIRISSNFSSQIVFWTQNFKNLRDIFLCNETPPFLLYKLIFKKNLIVEFKFSHVIWNLNNLSFRFFWPISFWEDFSLYFYVKCRHLSIVAQPYLWEW